MDYCPIFPLSLPNNVSGFTILKHIYAASIPQATRVELRLGNVLSVMPAGSVPREMLAGNSNEGDIFILGLRDG